MMAPQTNTDLPSIARALAERDDFVICGHVSPDGDCLGSQLALAHALRALGKRVTCVLAKDEPVEERLLFMPGARDFVAARLFEGKVDTFVAVDVPTPERMGDGAALQQKAAFTVTIDHHAVPENMSELSYVDPDAASTTLLIWKLAEHLGVPREGALACCAYTGLVTDTGRFQYQNTDFDALAAAAEMVRAGADAAYVARQVYQNRRLPSVMLESRAVSRARLSRGGQVAMSWVYAADFEEFGATKADAEPLIDTLRSLAGVRVACMLRDQGGVVRGSFRAKDDTDVAALAQRFGGGGHKSAAGFTMDGPMDAAVEEISVLLDGLFPETEEGGARA